MAERPTPSSVLTLTRSISSSGDPLYDDRREHGRLPVVGVVAAYRYQGLRLSVRLESIQGFRLSVLSARDVIMPRRPAPGDTSPPCDLLIIEPGDLPRETLDELFEVAQTHDVPLIWLGEPPIALRLATSRMPGGLLPAHASVEQIERALSAAQIGLAVTHPDYAHVTDQTEQDVVEDPLDADTIAVLSPREQEVLSEVAQGLPNKAIARKLGITDHTVKFHISSVLTKLDASSRSEAVAIATREGMLIDMPRT